MRSAGFYVVLALVLLVVLSQVLNRSSDEAITYSEFQAALENKPVSRVVSVEILDRSNAITGKWKNAAGVEERFRVNYPREAADELTTQLEANKVDFKVDPERESLWVTLLLNLLPFVLLIGIFVWLINSMQGGGSRIMQFGKAKAKVAAKDQPKVSFADVAGCDEAVEELHEIKEFLENPAKFAAIGAKIPKGVLLFGPPGTGKTLLAKAVAGEAGVPFLSISGSDFVEMFVGVGASRVRDLFEQAKASSPAIIFVDEIDAVGRHRGAGLGGGHDEREQTLNQLLVEMDGFDTRAGVIMIAATNRPDILDPALLRPGRFDRQIMVDRPDIEGRRAIFRVHAKGKPLDSTVDLDVLARRTPGFTGADIANLMNEAALLAARRNLTIISMAEMEGAIDRVIAGPEKKSRVMTDEERRVIAYHEGGHALVGHVLPHADPIHKISIVSRGRALGWTLALPEQDKVIVTRSAMRDDLAMLLGGRTAEEIVFGEPSTGAQNDIERATQVARSMVTEFGMSDLLGPQQFGEKNGEVFLGRDFGRSANYSDEVATNIDAEIGHLIDSAHATAFEILNEHRATLDRLAQALLDQETLDHDDVDRIFADLPKWTKKPDDSAPLMPAPLPPEQMQARTPVAVASSAKPGESALARVRAKAGRTLRGRINPGPAPTT